MVDLTPFNTFRVQAFAQQLLELNGDVDPLVFPSAPYLILGGGSNVLFVRDYPGTIVKNNLKGRKVISQTDTEVTIELASGEIWDEIVNWTTAQGWSGMENMAAIPGTVGAAAVGNIAAYGQNQEDIFVSLQATNTKSQETIEFNKNECEFGYRESFFKKNPDYFVISIRYRLFKTPHFDTSYHSRYESLTAFLPTKNKLTPQDIAQAVTQLRATKLPDWHQVGTAGSFFKNPVITKAEYLKLSDKLPGLQWYPVEKLQYNATGPVPAQVKVPAGRLLDELGWKGKRIGNVGTHTTHALTVVNYGGASGQEIYDFTQAMQADVQKHFGLTLIPEVVLV